jgi:hypothetical protein
MNMLNLAFGLDLGLHKTMGFGLLPQAEFA